MSTNATVVQARSATPAAAADKRGDNYKWIALSNTTLGVLMVTINQSILLISLPDIFRGIALNPLTPSNTSYFLWVFMGFLLVTAVLVVSLGRVGDMFGRVRMYNLGFAVFTLFSILLSVTWLTGVAGAIWIIVMRVFQGVGGAFLFANSSAILTDAFPPDERGKAMGINGVAAVSGAFLGLVLGGVLAPVEWRLVFLVSVPFGLFGTVWAYLMLKDNGIRVPAKIDWRGNAAFAVGLVASVDGDHLLAPPLRGPPDGLDQPVGAAGRLRRHGHPRAVRLHRDRVAAADVPPQPVPDPSLHRRQHRRPSRCPGPGRSPVHADHLAAGHLATPARVQLQPDAAVGRHVHGPADPWVPGHGAHLGHPVRPPRGPGLATAGLALSGAAFLLLELLPMNFSYIWFALLIFLFAVGMGLFFSPNQASVMNSLPPDQRGAGAGMLNTFQNSATVLSMGLFFTIVTLGLAADLPIAPVPRSDRCRGPAGPARPGGQRTAHRQPLFRLPRAQPGEGAPRADRCAAT